MRRFAESEEFTRIAASSMPRLGWVGSDATDGTGVSSGTDWAARRASLRRWTLALSLCAAFGCVAGTVAAAAEASSLYRLAVGGDDACAVSSKGIVECWGSNADGQLGDASTSNSDRPMQVHGAPESAQVAVGNEFACALLSSARVECWGKNSYGDLGDGSTTPTETPVEVSGIATATQLAAGGNHACALTTSRQVMCWGENYYGQLGNGTNRTESHTPVQVQGIGDAVEVAVGYGFSCALRETGVIDCWGGNGDGELGNGTQEASTTPVEVGGITGATQVSAGNSHACALLASGRIKCWGDNGDGELGNGTEANANTPVPVLGVTGASQVAAGASQSCALLVSGAAECWGANTRGQLGDGDETLTNSSTPVPVSNVLDAVEIATGGEGTCATMYGGTTQCWGGNSDGQLGAGIDSNTDSPATVERITEGENVATGGFNTCSVVTRGDVDCWGFNGFGQLGDGSYVPSELPVRVLNITNAVGVATDGNHSCAVLTTKHVECWGDDNDYQLGNAKAGYSSQVPMEVEGIGDAQQLALDQGASCSLLATQHVVCWGYNYANDFGRTTPTASQAPVEVPGLEDAVQLSIGAGACAVLENGKVECWGGSFSANGSLSEVTGVNNALQVAVGNGFACAELVSHHLDCWGSNNEHGQLGNGTLASGSNTPTEVHGISRAIQIAAGINEACATIEGGDAVCWGEGQEGQLGNGSLSERSAVPVTVDGISEATEVAVGERTACAVLISGQDECWGSDEWGQLGTDAAWSTLPLEVAFSAGPEAPVVVTEQASAITETAAQLNATVDPEGRSVKSCRFEYGESSALGDSVACANEPGAGTEPVSVAATVARLQSDTKYYFRIAAATTGDWSYGRTQTFVTPISRPTVVTAAASEVEEGTAVLEGTVDPNGSEVEGCWFELGEGETYGTEIPCSALPGAGRAPVSVTSAASGLKAGTTYHYRLAAVNKGGTAHGLDRTLTTATEGPPEIGRCVHQAQGAFKDAKCTETSSGGAGSYEWAPPPLTKAGFRGVAKTMTMETVGGISVKCQEAALLGEYVSARKLTATLTAKGCDAPGAFGGTCTSEGASSGEVVSAPLVGQLRIVSGGAKPVVGWVLTGARSEVAGAMECGANAIAVTGELIAPIASVDKMGTSTKLKVKQKKGHQEPEQLEGAGKEVLVFKVGDSEQQAGLAVSMTLSNEEPVEIRAES
jgi:alpha-tubulin suppressor-like RCC1 family protein